MSIFTIISKEPLPEIGVFDKFKLISGLCPNPIYKKLLEIGKQKLENKMDLINILKNVETGEDNTIQLDEHV